MISNKHRSGICLLVAFIGFLVVGIVTDTASANDRAETKILGARPKDFPTLVLLAPGTLDVTTNDPDSDFICYYVSLHGAGKQKSSAQMTIYEGQFPQPLSKYVGKQDFFQKTAKFGTEWSCWYEWISKDSTDGPLHAMAYLYNTASSGSGERAVNFIVQIHISGAGPDYKRLQAIAETIRAKK